MVQLILSMIFPILLLNFDFNDDNCNLHYMMSIYIINSNNIIHVSMSSNYIEFGKEDDGDNKATLSRFR